VSKEARGTRYEVQDRIPDLHSSRSSLLVPQSCHVRYFVTGILFPALFFLHCSFDPFRTTFDDTEDAVMYEAAEKTSALASIDTLTIMAWNIKFAGGRIDFFFDCYGDRTLMTKDEVTDNLDGLVRKINQVNPDILLLEEADIESKRCAYVDNIQYILDHTKLNYGAYASQWKADYVPSDGIGRINSGNVILSKWKLSDAERIALPLQSEQDALTRYFYLRRNILTARAAVPGQANFRVICIHADAYSQDGTKKKHIDRFKAEIDRFDAAGALVVAGGDLNSLPPGSTMLKDFPDSKCVSEDFQADDFSEETEWLVPLYTAYAEAIPLAVYQADQASYFSHTTDKDGFWNRRLDYIFTNNDSGFVTGAGMVHQDIGHGGMETMPLSDHAPITVRIVLP